MKYVLCATLVTYAFAAPLTGQAATHSDSFHSTYKVTEAGMAKRSLNHTWWLSSGAYFYSENGVGRTIQGTLPFYDPWRLIFSASNPKDTDNGYRPQNIFRLVLKKTYGDYRQEAYFKIARINISESTNRNASNGVFFFNRYRDEFNVYYTGIRVDGYAVIKKKFKGTYSTLAYKKVFDGSPYDKQTNTSLLPFDTWIGLASELRSNTDGSVTISVFVERDGVWKKVAEATDTGKQSAILPAGYLGIRTDFMDVQFDDYRIESL